MALQETLRAARGRVAIRLSLMGNGEVRHPEVYRTDLELRLVLVPIVDIPAGFFLTVDG